MPSKLKMHVLESRVDWAPWRYIIEKQGRVVGGRHRPGTPPAT